MQSDGKKGMSYFLDGKSPSIKTSNSKGVFSVSLVQVNLSLELFENRIFVRRPSDFHLEFSVRKPNCSNCETFKNRGMTVPIKDVIEFPNWINIRKSPTNTNILPYSKDLPYCIS